MRNILLFLFLSFTSEHCNAQKEAFNWVHGICEDGNPCQDFFRTSVIKFNNDSIESIRTPGYFGGPFYLGTASISDGDGNLLMAFNGKTLFDSVGNQLAVMNDLPIGQFSIGFKSFLFLKLKTEIPLYYLLYNYSYSLDTPISDFLIRGDFNIIKVGILVDSTGYTILSNDTIPFDTPNFPGHIEATRHANGRDWWVLKSGMHRNSFVRGILNSNELGFEAFTTEADSMYNNAQIWHAFSADGTKFFHFMGNSIRILDVYDFDRCTGDLSNLRSFDFSNIILETTDYNPFTLSSDATKIYMVRENYLTQTNVQVIQFDLNNSTFKVMKDSIAMPCLTPNLKQIIAGQEFRESQNSSIVPYLTILRNPNSGDEDCFFENYAYPFTSLGFSTKSPNWANHMLGPIDGSSCDTLGLDQDYTWLPKVEEETFWFFQTLAAAH